MHVASKGTGPVVLFLHGFPELWYSWRHQLLNLSTRGYHAHSPRSSQVQRHRRAAVGDIVHDVPYRGRPDRVKALVNSSVAFHPRNPARKTVDGFRTKFGDDYYICRFQEPGEVEEEFAQIDTAKLMKKLLTMFNTPKAPCIPKNTGFKGIPDPPALPSWLSEEDVNYYAVKFNQKGFIGGLNYYRWFNLSWELAAPWTGVQIKVPVKFIVGDLDLVFNIPGTKEYIHNGGFKKDVPLLQEIVVMDGVAHFLNQEKPEEVSEHIYDFINKF
ncbi:hypothetical protein EZV62_010389 [Acer yangbiense]|uniref:AB hydrolase-1 domain-containing protein n=1 Tax=Acer yangbiense TaxID=1000413 RepID=A0A5C7I2S3_9ROSI|nr:hypothetical protein EZV62_010389 [Acer yangbiense]